MTKKTYERLIMDVTEFDIEDVITTSEPETPVFGAGLYESPIDAPVGIF